MDVITNNNIKCTVALSALSDVLDPEIGLNVVDLGLIYQMDFDEEDKTIETGMTLTTPFCPMGESITYNVTEKLASTFKDYRVQVALTFDPPWNFGRLTPEGREFLNR